MKLNKIALGLLLTFGLAYAEKVDLNFDNVEIGDFIKMISKITNKNILVDGEIKGKINFVSNTPIDKEELIPLANAILESKKMTLVDKGEYYQVVKSNDAAGEGMEVREESIGTGGTMRTVIFQLTNDNAAVIRTKIKPLLHNSAKVISFKKDNLLAITAYPHTLKSIKQLIDKIENRPPTISKVITLQNAYVKDIFPNIQTMSKTLFAQDIDSEKVSTMQDLGSNSIILVGNSKNVNRMAQYIQQLDMPRQASGDFQRMYVIPLENSNVEEMEKILSRLVPQMTENLGGVNAVDAPAAAPTPVSTGGTRGPIPTDAKVQKAVIASDLERNALIILANETQIQNIRETIRALDVEKSQVYIQAKIVEVDTNLAENIGIKYGFNGGSITSNGIFSMIGNAGAAPLAISSELLGFLNNTTTQFDNNGNAYTTNQRAFEFNQGIKEVFSMGVQLDLLKQNGAAQILSEPSILSTNNKESSIYVGQTQSILTQSQQSTQGNSNVLNNYSREDIGITLKVKPRLSSDNKVNLEVETTIEDILPGSGTAADRPTTTKRAVNTNAIVNHGETIILGGLTKSAVGDSSTRIPILGDIPILGRLFSSNGESKSQVSVVIYLTPYIVTKSTDLAKLRKYLDELESVQDEFNKLVLDKLEQRRLGIDEDRSHVTFATQSAKRNQTFRQPAVAAAETTYQPRIEQPTGYVESGANSYGTESVYESIPASSGETMRSESILETINQQNRPIDLDQLNTGIEYNENTTFINE